MEVPARISTPEIEILPMTTTKPKNIHGYKEEELRLVKTEKKSVRTDFLFLETVAEEGEKTKVDISETEIHSMIATKPKNIHGCKEEELRSVETRKNLLMTDFLLLETVAEEGEKTKVDIAPAAEDANACLLTVGEIAELYLMKECSTHVRGIQ